MQKDASPTKGSHLYTVDFLCCSDKHVLVLHIKMLGKKKKIKFCWLNQPAPNIITKYYRKQDHWVWWSKGKNQSQQPAMLKPPTVALQSEARVKACQIIKAAESWYRPAAHVHVFSALPQLMKCFIAELLCHYHQHYRLINWDRWESSRLLLLLLFLQSCKKL